MIQKIGWIVATAALAFTLPVSANEQFPYHYQPGSEPEKAVPGWQCIQRRGSVNPGSGKLAVEVPVGLRHGYAIGKRSDGTGLGDTNAWTMTTGKATVEFRVRCEADFPDVEVFRLLLSDGTQFWPITFYPNRVAGKEIDATQMRTYRATVDEGRLVLSTEADGVIYTRASGNSSTETAQSVMIGFGTLHSNRKSSHSGNGMVRWELEFIRWTNQIAMPPLGK